MSDINYEYADDVKKIAEQVIKEYEQFKHINIDDIFFIRTSKHIMSGHVLGRTHELIDMVKFLTKKKYIIEIPPVFDTKNDKVKSIIIEHELMHIPIDNKKGLVGHDIEDFKEIIKKYGIEWISELEEAEIKIKSMKEIEKKKKQIKKFEEEKDEILEEKTTEEDEKMKNINKEEDVDYDPDEEIDKDSDEPE